MLGCRKLQKSKLTTTKRNTISLYTHLHRSRTRLVINSPVQFGQHLQLHRCQSDLLAVGHHFFSVRTRITRSTWGTLGSPVNTQNTLFNTGVYVPLRARPQYSLCTHTQTHTRNALFSRTRDARKASQTVGDTIWGKRAPIVVYRRRHDARRNTHTNLKPNFRGPVDPARGDFRENFTRWIVCARSRRRPYLRIGTKNCCKWINCWCCVVVGCDVLTHERRWRFNGALRCVACGAQFAMY